MTSQRITVKASPELIAAAAASLALAHSVDPAELQRQIAAQNTPARLAATRSRLARARRNRIAAETAYWASR